MDTTDLSQLTASPGAFEELFGEQLAAILDIRSWHHGEDPVEMLETVAAGVAAAVEAEARLLNPIRAQVFPHLATRPDAPPGAGVYRATVDDLRGIYEGLLFTGAVEACDATSFTHETLSLSFTQIGVGLVTYQGNQDTWVQRIFRRDLHESLGDPAEEALALLEKRSRQDDEEAHRQADLSQLARQAITAYATRAFLLHHSTATWRVGRGNPAPFELLTGAAGSLDIMIEATKLLEELICGHRKFLYVPPEVSTRLLRVIAGAMQPLEYAIVGTLRDTIEPIIESSRDYYDHRLPTASDTTIDGRRLTPREWIRRFVDQVASQVVVGLYRASELTPAHMFFAHVDHAHEAALIALADGLLQPHRGTPMLLDLAKQVCDVTFGPESLAAALQLGYTRAGAPLQYLSGRHPH
ncbi:MAG: hypothetical protein QOF51_3592 [Chloroflexota bacterium]|jgi:hypothetical protein|nr:hypothetical protein [Chloroflexota bacterium]